MSYTTPGAFREALDARIRRAAAAEGREGAVLHLRKLVVYDRLLARLLAVAPDRWVVKGGVALSLRLQGRARMTRDLDLAFRDDIETVTEDLIAATECDLPDGFTFAILLSADPSEIVRTVRYTVRAELGGRRFEDFTIDVGLGETAVFEPEMVPGIDALAFAGIEPITVPTLPLRDQVAQKVHAYTSTYGAGRVSTRVKDLVDLVLISGTHPFESIALRDALTATFDGRGTHPLPAALPPAPSSWAVAYRMLASTVELNLEVRHGHAAAAAFLDPILMATNPPTSTWDSVARRWSD